jgi:hypothetical protein
MEVLIKLTNGGSIRILCSTSQLQSLSNGGGIQTDMYGFIAATSISSWKRV